ncbi:MAG: DUF3160 domain-containing protein [Thermoplasmata archaeon]|nr:MAG: DUF3160 domain-containing protein [Thermoplasmata archaeon]
MKGKMMIVLVLMCLLTSGFGDGLSVQEESKGCPDTESPSDVTFHIIYDEQEFPPHSRQDYGPTINPATPWFDTIEQDEYTSPIENDEIKDHRENIGDMNSPFDFETRFPSSLDLDLENAEYYTNISLIFTLNHDVIQKLRDCGLIVVNHSMFNEYQRPITSFEDAYHAYWENDLPIIITTDTILNTYHLLFDQMLKDLEKTSLSWRLEYMSEMLMNDSIAFYGSLDDGLARDISREAAIFFTVPACLMDNSTVVPQFIKEDVDYYIEKIMSATDVVEEHTWDGKSFYSDYTQYKPRGHYAGDEALERYFRCMMWYGRKSLDMNFTNAIREAIMISKLLDDNTDAQRYWYEIYNITRYLVGASDSLNFMDIKRAVINATGEYDLYLLGSDESMHLIREEFQKPDYISQRILSTVVVKGPSQACDQMDFPKIFQFMGQRYVPDSEVMQNVIYDRVPLYEGKRRGLANGLDVMASLGSFRAVEHLGPEIAHYNYSANLRYAYDLMGNMPDGFWNDTAYNGWLKSYSALVAHVPNSTQPFMQTAAWADGKLNTVLGSWSELRHDTILYAKQPYSMSISCSTPDAWVEPYPQFYNEIAHLCNRTISILMQNLDGGYARQRFIRVFSDFEDITNTLSAISEKELQNMELTQEEKDFLKGIFVGTGFAGCGGPWVKYGWLPELLRNAKVDEKTMDTRIIADVNTDPGSDSPPMPPRVLHVGSGYVETLIVLYQMPDGSFTFAVGPVYSYYEFPQLGFTRLTDDDWKAQLGKNTEKRPFWTGSFLVNEGECLLNEYA